VRYQLERWVSGLKYDFEPCRGTPLTAVSASTLKTSIAPGPGFVTASVKV